ncbi:alpha/beta fold hydrolase [Amycolatopsis tucumanensis]|uniref:alpha/beta fold hydrolase n=1 Tax=Amycolatopsis tucumanensis TaxID=401106 RepID=UPI003557D855
MPRVTSPVTWKSGRTGWRRTGPRSTPVSGNRRSSTVPPLGTPHATRWASSTRLDVPAAHLVGHSQGGFTALRAALLAGERVASLTLVDTAADAFPGAGADGADPGRFCRRFGGAGTVPGFARSGSTLAAAVGTATGRAVEPCGGCADGRGQRGAPARRDHRAGAGGARQRGLAIPPEAGVALAAVLPAAEPVEVLDGVAHTPPVTHAALFSALLQRFLKAHR